MLGQNFAKQFDLKFQTEAGGEEYAYNTSWGVSTRLVGGLVMSHGDDSGLILPPRLAPVQVVVVPIYRKDEERAVVMEKAEQVARSLSDAGVRVHVDARDNLKPGPKFYEWERKGVPVRVEIGPRDVASQQLTVVLRATPNDLPRKESVGEAGVVDVIRQRLDELQRGLLQSALERREANSHRGIASYANLRELIEDEGGFVFAGWCGSEACEQKVKEDTKATIRVLPLEEFRSAEQPATCVVCGQAAQTEAVWARAY
jgi:prolyl-tRNA synthetase